MPNLERRQRRRGLWIGEIASGALIAVQHHGLAPFALAFAMFAPAALAATALEFWFDLPGSFLIVALSMSVFGLYLAAVTPLLVNDEAAARHRSLTALIDKADARMLSLALAGAVSGVLIAAGLELRLLPGFLVLGLLSLTAPAIVREKLASLAGLRRGLHYTQGNAVAFATLGALVGSVSLGIYALTSFVLEPLPSFLGEFVAVAATATLAAPIAVHTFVNAFDARVGGRRVGVRPPMRGRASEIATTGRLAVERARSGPSASSVDKRPRVSFVQHRRPESSQLRYSPDAATMTLRANIPPEARSVIPDWAQTDESVSPDELHTAV